MQTVIGLDYGTLSARALLTDLQGNTLAEASFDYPHGVMEEMLPCGRKLPVDFALQHPQDYTDALEHIVPAVLKKAGVDGKSVIGIGIDFTSSTWMPIRADGTPLCLLPEYAENPHAWVKLWKHHGAGKQAARMEKLAAERGEAFLARYGGKISPEFQVPKTLETLENAPEIYENARYFTEAGDWLVMQLTGTLKKSACMMGYKGMWSRREGYPSAEYFAALDPRMAHYPEEKLDVPVAELGSPAGYLTSEMAAGLGLPAGIPVATPCIDAHASLPAVGITEPGQLTAIMGTSACFLLLEHREVEVSGMSGAVDGGVYPGFIAYEAGQSCMGDHYAWFASQCCPAAYAQAAKAAGMSLHAYLTREAAKLAPGESGLLALDWWNGSRSVLQNADLTGLMLGLTLHTRPEEIYRALIEATAYGARRIVQSYTDSGLAVHEIRATGGISVKNAMAMQIYADVLGIPVRLAGETQGAALGSAIAAAVAAGAYPDFPAAVAAMHKVTDTVFTPNPDSQAVYETLYGEYLRLYDTFGRGENPVMAKLKALRLAAKAE